MEGFFPYYSPFECEDPVLCANDEDTWMDEYDGASPIEGCAEFQFESESSDEWERVNSDGGGGGGRIRGRDPENGPLFDGQRVDVVSLLSTETRDFVVDNEGNEVKLSSPRVKGKRILIHCFELPVSSYDDEGILCWTLKRAMPYWSNFLLIVVAKMRTNDATEAAATFHFNSFLAGFGSSSCLAIPISDSASYHHVFRFFCGGGVIVDPYGLILCACPSLTINSFGARSFPFTPDHLFALESAHHSSTLIKPNPPLDILLRVGPSFSLRNAAGNDSILVSHLQRKLVGLYLCRSGHRMHVINQTYHHCRANALELEVVLVYLPLSDHPSHFISCANAALKAMGISSWWLLPFRDFTSRNLWNFCEQSVDDEFIVVGPRSEFLDAFAVDILTRGSDSIRDMYPYAVEPIARQETRRLHKLTLDSFLPDTCLISAQTGYKTRCHHLQGKTVCLFIANLDHPYRPHEALSSMRDWYRDNRKRRRHKDYYSKIVLVFVPLVSTTSRFRQSSDPRVSLLSEPQMSWLSDPSMSWLICPPDRCSESSIMKHATLRGLPDSMCSPLSFITFGQDGKLISMAWPQLSEIQSRAFRLKQLYKEVLVQYVEELYDDRQYV